MSSDYLAYRKASQKLIRDQVVATYADKDVLDSAGRYLGLLHDKVMVLGDENDAPALFDFAVFESRIEGETLLQHFRARTAGLTAMEEEILDVCDAAFCSLFQVASTAPGQGTLVIQDLLDMRGDILLSDIGTSATAQPGMLFFARILTFARFSMTSGVGFPFEGKQRGPLLKGYKLLCRKKITSGSPSARRFAAFFMLHQTMGVEMRYGDVAGGR